MLSSISFQKPQQRTLSHPLADKTDRQDIRNAEELHDVGMTETPPGDDFLSETLNKHVSKGGTQHTDQQHTPL
jgi:hypothetical protein